MSVGEGANADFLPEDLTQLENPMAAIVAIERTKRREAFVRLREHIERVELLGRDDASRQSFHKYYVGEDGDTRLVLFNAGMYKGFGRMFRVIVNTEHSALDGSRELDIADYIVAADSNNISVFETFMERAKGTHSWGDIDNYTGPVLRERSMGVEIAHYPNYGIALPDSGSGNYIEILDRRTTVEDLCGVLSCLSEVTLQDGVYND